MKLSRRAVKAAGRPAHAADTQYLAVIHTLFGSAVKSEELPVGVTGCHTAWKLLVARQPLQAR